MLSASSSDSVPVDRPLVSPIMVGRAPYMQALGSALGASSVGNGGTMLVSGEAGVGKSRCVNETEAMAAKMGVVAAKGHCFENDRALPYAPLLDLLHSLWASQSLAERERYWRPYAASLVRLLPELEAFAGANAGPILEPEQEKRRLFLAMQGLLSGLSADKPLLILIEDIHWADDLSLEFLLHLARVIRNTPLPLLLVVTYRSDEAANTNPLSRWLVALDRERLALELRLGGLSRDDVGEMLQAIFEMGRPVRADFLDTIFTLTEGNAFFIEEVLKSLVQSGGIFLQAGVWERKPVQELSIPRSVQDAVARRTNTLSDDAASALVPAAVIGRRFDFPLLQALTGRDEAALLASVKELIGAQLVVEESEDLFSFRHALTRQAVYSSLLARERRSMHRAVAETMIKVYGNALDSHLSDLAYHSYQAGMWDAALDYSRKAGDAAQALYAPGAAIEQYTRAKEAAHKLGVEPPAALYRARGLQYEIRGEFENARNDYETALRIFRAARDEHGEWQALIDLGKLWTGLDYGRAGEYFLQALALARPLDEPAMLAYSLNWVGNWHVNIEQPSEAAGLHKEALDIFTRLHDRRGEAETLDLIGLMNFLGSDLATSADYLRRAIPIFTEIGDRRGLASSMFALMLCSGSGYQNDTMVGVPPAQLDAIKEGETAYQIAREIGWRTGEADALWALTYQYSAECQYERALDRGRMAVRIADEVEHRQWMAASRLVLGAILVDVYNLDEAHAMLEEGTRLAEASGSRHWIGTAHGFVAWCRVAMGDLAGAQGALAIVWSPDLPMQTLAQRTLWRALAILKMAEKHADEALEIIDRLFASARNLRPPSHEQIPFLALLRGQILIQMGESRYTEAENSLLEACKGAEARGMLRVLWRTQATLGDLYTATNRPQDAEQALTNARLLVADIASGISEEHLREAFLRGAQADYPSIASKVEQKKSPRQATPGGLTTRELDVVRRVAQGKTNREIADDLILGERTIETHVGNALSKLGFTSRAQLAAWAVEQNVK